MEMKKVLFNTLCVSALLTACTDNELATMTPDNGQGEKIEVKIGAEYSDFIDEAGTRMTLVGNEWAWVNGDMLGACKVATIDEALSGVNGTVSSNYPFVLTKELTEPVKTATFKTNTAVFAGQYAFYHQYNGDLIGAEQASKDLFKVTFPAVQVVDPTDAVAHIASENTWVSPVIKLGGIKYEAENETAIKFVSLNAILKLNITNNSTDGDLVINKVDVNGAKIPQEGNLDFAAKFGAGLNASGNTYGDDLDAAIKTMNNAATDLLATGATKAGEKISAIITGDGISVKKGASTVVYVLIPAGVYKVKNDETANAAINSFTVYTNKGQFTINAQSARKGSDKGPVDVNFNRNSLLNLYPVLEGKATAVEKYEIDNKSDWKNAVAYALANINQMIEFELKADIDVDELPSCLLYVTGADKGSGEKAKLVLNSEKSFTMVGGSYFEVVENKGTLNMKDNVYVGSLTNKGTVNVAATEKINGIATALYDNWKGSKTYGVNTLSNQGTIVLNGQMNNGAGTWTNTAAVPNTSTLGTIQINDKAGFVLGAAMTNAGKIVNNGTIDVTKAVLTNNGAIEVATATGRFVGGATKGMTNNGAINLDAAKDVFVDENGKVITGNSIVTNNGTGKVEVAIAPADVTTALPAIEEVNSIRMSGAWNQELLTALKDKWENITAQTWEGVTLDIDGVGTELSGVTSLVINGTSAIKNSGTDETELGLNGAAAAAKITINGDLTIAKHVTIGKEVKNSPEITVLGSVVNNGNVFAGLTVGAPAKDGAPANTSAKFTNNEKATVDVVSACATDNKAYTYGNLDIYGTFVNNDEKDAVKVKAVILEIQGKSTYTGTYTDGE